MHKKSYILISILLLNFMAIAGQAATRTVTNLDGGSAVGSLRERIAIANAGDTIVFQAGLSGQISLINEIVINKNLIISGPGANVIRVSGLDSFRVFNVSAGNVQISGLRITDGFASGAGGGVLVDGGNLTLNNCQINGNDSESGGGAIVFTGSTLTITNSTINGNTSAVEGGGVSNRGGTLFLTNTTITGNTAPRGGGVSIDGGTATILNSTISGNRTGDSTTSNVGGLRAFSGSVILKNTIVAGNSDSFAPITQVGETVNLQNTNSIENPAFFGVSIFDIGGTINSQGTNLIGNSTGGSGFIASDLLNVNPQLSTLAANGGTTPTQALMAGSPAINAGNNSGAPATDQRGVARPQGAAVDIGAYESGVNPVIFGKIAYVNAGANYEIFSMNGDGSNQTNLTNNTAFDSNPNWSPDGSKIVFVSDRASFGTTEIYTMNANGSNPTRLTTNSVTDETPAWSPDGARIAFARSGQLFVMNADGTNVIQITANASSGVKLHPSWSPDGTRIVFSRNLGFGNIGIAVIDSACNICTAGIRVLNNGLPTDNFDPAWSPNGSAIAFSNDQTDFDDHSLPETFLIDDINDFNSPPRPLVTPINPRIFSPAWSPDSTKLVYQNNSFDLFTINANGTNQTSLGVSGRLPAWGGFNTPTGANVSAIAGTSSITFSNVSTSGTTLAAPIDPATAGTLPGGYTLGAGFPAYEITTTAVYTAPITVCLQVPGVTDATIFNALTLFHSEGGILIDRTVSRNFATKTICASVSSLSPFVVAQNLAPSTANVSVSGRVSTAEGYGISRARVSIVNQNGETRTVLTSSFGYFRFDEIPAGETYVISVHAKSYQFNSQVLTVSEDIQNADFTALP